LQVLYPEHDLTTGVGLNIVPGKDVTVTLDEETVRWARVWAARRNSSVSRLLGEVLTERMRQETGY